MSIRVLAPHLSCVVPVRLSEEDPDYLQQALDQGYSQIYVLTPEGIIKHHKLNGENRYLRLKVDSVPGLKMDKMDEAIQFLPSGKIPLDIFDQVEAFFRKVMEVKNSDVEAMIFILWSRERGYHLHVPDQQISKASVRYDWDGIPEGSTIVVDIH